MCVAAAIIGSGVVGAAGSAIAGSQAAKATKAGAGQALSFQEQALRAQELMSAPYRKLGTDAIGKLEALLGLRGGAAGQTAQHALAATPGYQFAKQQGLADTVNQASAMGLGLSGNTLQGLERFGTGLADQTYQSAIGNLMGTVGIGESAAANQAANFGQFGANAANIAQNRGNTLAGIDANTVAGITKSIGNAADMYALNQTLGGLGGGGSSTYTGDYYGPWATNLAMQQDPTLSQPVTSINPLNLS